jgi:formate hydrogenlyase transcriptional activator
MNRPHDLYVELEDRLRFEMLLTELSAQFVSVTSESIDYQIVDAQRRIVQALDFDHSILAQLEVADRFVITHSWHLPGLEPSPGFVDKDSLWMRGAVARGEVVCFARIDDLPAEAVHEKEVARRFGPVANITFPLKIGDKVIRGMAFSTAYRRREWAEAIVNRLRLFVDMIGSAIARTRAEEALHESEYKLFHSLLHAGLSRRSFQANALIQLQFGTSEWISDGKRPCRKERFSVDPMGQYSNADSETI